MVMLDIQIIHMYIQYPFGFVNGKQLLEYEILDEN